MRNAQPVTTRRTVLLVIVGCLAASSAAAQAKRPQDIRGGESALADAPGRTPSFGKAAVSFSESRRLVKKGTGLELDSSLIYFHWQLGLSSNTNAQLVLCGPTSYTYQNGRWECSAEAGRRVEFVTIGENREFLHDLIKSTGTFRLWWYLPAADGQPGQPKWSTPFDVSQ
jgi:hypothetical protein